MTTSNLSFVRYKGDGSTTTFSLVAAGENMGYFRTDDIHTYVNNTEVPNVIQPQSPHIVHITPAPVAGSDILIRREMPIKKPYSDFSRGNNFGHRQVNNTFLQQLYLTHELLDGFLPDGFYMKQGLNMGGYPITNLADPQSDTDATNVQSVKALVANYAATTQDATASITVSASISPDFQVFDLTQLFGVSKIDALTVFINGVYQEPIRSYTLTDTSCIFSEQLDRISRITFILANVLIDTIKVVSTEKSRVTHIAVNNQQRFVAPSYNIGSNELIVSIQGVVQSIETGAYIESTNSEIIIDEPLSAGTIVEIYRIK